MKFDQSEFEDFKKQFNSDVDIQIFKLFIEKESLNQHDPPKSKNEYIVGLFKKGLNTLFGSPVTVAIIGGLLTYTLTIKSNNQTANNQIELEKRKLNSTLIIDAIKDKTISQVRSNLEVLKYTNLIDTSIDINNLNKFIYSTKSDSVNIISDSLAILQLKTKGFKLTINLLNKNSEKLKQRVLKDNLNYLTQKDLLNGKIKQMNDLSKNLNSRNDSLLSSIAKAQQLLISSAGDSKILKTLKNGSSSDDVQKAAYLWASKALPENLRLTLHREIKSEKSTIGKLYINGDFFCWTLEPQDQGLAKNVNMADKIQFKTAIPTGNYSLKITFNQTHQTRLPTLDNVPGFQDITIHIGNYPTDTNGSILVGFQPYEDAILQSRNTFNMLMPILSRAKRIDITVE